MCIRDRFFDLLGEERCAEITHVSADSARWITNAVTAKCPQAVQCADPFHVVAWATDALDELRRETWNDARKLARTEPKRQRGPVSYTHLRAHETVLDLVCRLLLETTQQKTQTTNLNQ